MNRRALVMGHASLTSILGQIPKSLACFIALPCSLNTLRHLATPSIGTPSSEGQRHAPPHNGPYLTADIFGWPSVVHPAANPREHGRFEPAGIDGERRGRRARSPRKAKGASSHDGGFHNAPAAQSARLPLDDRSVARWSEATEATDRRTKTGSLGNFQHRADEPYPHTGRRSSRPTFSDGQLRTRDRASLITSPNAGPSQALLPEDENLDRKLTYRLLKAESLQELDKLLGSHTGAPNVIHLAAAARQAVLLASLARPQETRTFLDKNLQRWAEGAVDWQKELHQRHLARPHVATSDTVGAGSVGEPGFGQCALARTVGFQEPGLSGAGRATGRHSRQDQGLATDAGSIAMKLDRKAISEEVSITAAAASTPCSAPQAADAPNAAAAVPLRELSDVFWAYGKLRFKPPERLWSSTLRPMLLRPGALVHVREGKLEDNEGCRPPTSSGWRAAQSSVSLDSDGQGQTLSKLAVALARMREEDVEVWRALARAAAATAPGMSPRALTSLLWAFGSMRMSHGPLLLAAVRVIRLELSQLNGQDLACAMWALARLAPPPLPPPSAYIASRSARAAAATAAAWELLYGDLSDAVRRRMQLQGLKTAEITTLLGALDEMAQHQQHAHHQAPRQQASMTEYREGLCSGDLPTPAASTQLRGGRTLQVSPRLLRVVSQGVRKNLSSLPVGALAEAAAVFQRLGHHDAALYRALAAGMLVRLRYLEPWHLVRAALALQAVGYSDGAFFAKVLEVAQRDLLSYKTWEVLALVDLCGQLIAPNKASDDGGSFQHSSATDGAPRSKPAPAALVPTTARSFIHAAVLHAVSSIGASGRGDRRAAKAAVASGSGDAANRTPTRRAEMGPKPLRLRHWNQLLRAAVSVRWQDEDLVSRALDGMMLELQGLRGPWLAAVRSRNGDGRGGPWEPNSPGLQDHGRRMPLKPPQGGAAAEEDVSAGATAFSAYEARQTLSPTFDSTASDVAGMVLTAALLRQSRRVDVVAAAVSILLEVSNMVAAAVPAGSGPASESADGAESCGVARQRPASVGQVTSAGQHATCHPAAPRLGGLLALSPTASGELQAGLDYFDPELGMLANRRTRAAVQLLRQRLGLPGGWHAA